MVYSPSPKARKKYGEVLTPIFLVEEMLDTLPKEVWSNPNLKWLDPCTGPGVFVKCILRRLKEFHSEKHIMENMIYACELQTHLVEKYSCAFDPQDKIDLNIYHGSFLDEGFDQRMEFWGVEKFDITVGNPPYNQSIDLKFLSKSYPLTDKILFVHPSTWLLDEKGINKKFSSSRDLVNGSLKHVTLFNGNGVFGISLFVPCAVTYIDKKYNGSVHILDKINDVSIEYGELSEINKYSSFTHNTIRDKVLNVAKINNVWMHKGAAGSHYINMSQIRGDVSHRGKLGTSMSVTMVKDNFYSTVTKDQTITQQPIKHLYFGFKSEEEACNFLRYLKTKFAMFSLSLYKNNGNLHRGELASVPWLDFTKEWTDESLAKEFNLTEEEVAFIEKVIPDYY